ncbi:MAG: 50S ribosomal protein L5 [Thermoproteota archaeon]|jgi:large subunit ribosomal protein L5|nr:50S ribosomal protein L5 [Thermoproteota archaeon]
MSETQTLEIKEESKINPMTKVRLRSVTLNICVGSNEEKLKKAMIVLETLTGQKPSIRRAKKTIKEFKIKRGEPIACITTVRGKKAEILLDKLLEAVNRKLKASSFTEFGNFSFGIKEHISIPGMKYDPSIGIVGMDVCVNLEKPGYRVMYRKRRRNEIGKNHRVKKDEAIQFIKEKFNVVIE